MPIKSNLKSRVPRRQQYKQVITLLSHGYSSPQAWPDGRLTVFPWDNAIDQWIIENSRKLNKQDLMLGVLRNCCDLNGGNVDDFISEEVNLVLLVSRALTTDGVVSYTTTCPYCGFKKDEKSKVPEELEKVGEKTADYKGSDLIELAAVKDAVQLRPLLVRDEKLIINRKDEERKSVSDQELRTVMRVVSINDTKPETLVELVDWYRALHPADAKQLEENGRSITPHLNANLKFICDESDCGKKFNHPLTFDQEFFR